MNLKEKRLLHKEKFPNNYVGYGTFTIRYHKHGEEKAINTPNTGMGGARWKYKFAYDIRVKKPYPKISYTRFKIRLSRGQSIDEAIKPYICDTDKLRVIYKKQKEKYGSNCVSFRIFYDRVRRYGFNIEDAISKPLYCHIRKGTPIQQLYG